MKSATSRRRRAILETAGYCLAGWIVFSLIALMWAWAWPRTATGYLVAFTALPAATIIVMGTAELAVPWLTRVTGLDRFHRRIEYRTREERISPLRIGVMLAEFLVVGGILFLLAHAVVAILGLEPTLDGSFLDRHFWNLGHLQRD